jgi:predicted transcriptional regulator
MKKSQKKLLISMLLVGLYYTPNMFGVSLKQQQMRPAIAEEKYVPTRSNSTDEKIENLSRAVDQLSERMEKIEMDFRLLLGK